ncbi:ParB/RepB/Spo0J family partition protein [Catenulispora rubra]|uniref:ParB/RepB/Spo0J family partition protein n=1 Tax=Catenulispora rubra TaxID=280293 RepID=UPI0018924D5A|nr:ParB N-terminal domain-containing protein [Catenulispora rubra]
MQNWPDSAEYLISVREVLTHSAPVESVDIEELSAAYSARLAGADGAYVRSMADAAGDLPPIVVHRATMKVIDGVHRLQAARLNGQATIQVRFFDGQDDDGYLLAVAMNVIHGRPLSMEDRIAAAERILVSRPQWSDRGVAVIAGLSAKKVAEVRSRAVDGLDEGHRIGRDGRSRPLNFAHGRQVAADLLKGQPEASIRQIARQAGISPATVADVRNRLLRGEDPVPQREAIKAPDKEPEPGNVANLDQERALRRRRSVRSPVDPSVVLESLRRDPSLRFNETGRVVLRMLDACALFARDRKDIATRLPPHCKESMSILIQEYARIWQTFASELGSEDALTESC